MTERGKYMESLTDMMVFKSTSKEFRIDGDPELQDAKAHAKREIDAKSRTSHKKTDCFNPIGAPLDFTYIDIRDVAELLEHEPAAGVRKQTEAELAEQSTEAEMQIMNSRSAAKKKLDDTKTEQRRTYATGIKLAYNELASLDGLEEVLETLMENPKQNLTMIDLSHNQLTKVPSILAKYLNLSVIYLHGNKITNIQEVKKLNVLTKLAKITLHGNCVTLDKPGGGGKTVKRLEETRYYRPTVIYTLRNTLLKSLDQVPLTPKDRENALIWNKNHRGR